ncbi:seryl-threonyl protein kinase [Pectobacterium phage Q19]|uniref:Seryl-threonyl protein kinase n=1 Tax=Pectobacterium phage Q19 TaxID=2500576 RepID=A0A678ZK83_9CAUD|nr:seryl-threonyl protein kinase [Pectobacterium phage Q19]
MNKLAGYLTEERVTGLEQLVVSIKSVLRGMYDLPVSEITLRQPILVNLIGRIVNYVTNGGALTESKYLEGQVYWSTLEDMMRTAGFNHLGAGHFSVAYAHKALPGKVFKVGLKKEDSGAAYTAYSRMNAGQTGIPTIYDVQRHDSCYTVVMDGLLSIRSARNTDLEDWVNEQFSAVYRSIEGGKTWAQSLEYICEDNPKRVEHLKALHETGMAIRQFFNGIAKFDIHEGNAMVDAAGNLYITDPISFSLVDAGKHRETFIIDPEDVLKEVRAAREQLTIERCKRRKAARDPLGKIMMGRKSALKARRKRERQRKRDKEERRLLTQNRRLAYANEQREVNLARSFMGPSRFIKVRENVEFTEWRRIRAHEAAKACGAHMMQIMKGRSLPCDQRLQVHFLMG